MTILAVYAIGVEQAGVSTQIKIQVVTILRAQQIKNV